MVFTGTRQQQIELKINGFEMPHRHNTCYDFLAISLHAKSKSGTWEINNAALAYNEVLSLADWMIKVAESKHPFKSEMEFTEPCLTFNAHSKTDGRKRIRIGLGAEFRPPFSKEGIYYFIHCIMTNNELKKAAADLQSELPTLVYPKKYLYQLTPEINLAGNENSTVPFEMQNPLFE